MTLQDFLDRLSEAPAHIARGLYTSAETLVAGFQAIPDSVWPAVAAIGTAAAAIFAARSASISRETAKAAQEAVDEARLARKEERAPRLVLEKDFLDFKIVGPHSQKYHGRPFYEARQDHTTGYRQIPATFSLTNHGGGPALELLIVFDLEDPNGELAVPAGMGELGPLRFTVGETVTTREGLMVPTLEISQTDGTSSVELPMYKRATFDLPNCAPGQTRKVDLPQGLLARLLLRGFQYWPTRGQPDGMKDIIMTVRIRYHSIDGDLYKTQFRFRVFPFWQGDLDPLMVSSHIFEMAMYPNSGEPRVA